MPKITLNLDDTPAMSMAESFERLSEKKITPNELGKNLNKAVGFRNLSVHSMIKSTGNLFATFSKEI